jgi:RNA polymerase sigma factor (sigma-70 family)
MAWQDVLPLSVTRIDAEQEREMRLVAQARAGADWALAALVARYQPPVTRYLTRLTGDADIARALAERIFLRMDRRLRGPHGGHQLRLWLLRACTEAGLEAVRQPRRPMPARLEGPRFAGLLTGRVGEGAAYRLRVGWEALAEMTGPTRRQVRKLVWNADPAPAAAIDEPAERASSDSDEDDMFPGRDPREALRFRLIRAVLVELPYGDSQCLALHLVAGLNQAEVASALGITQSATRRRIVHGLQLFAQRYEAAAASLGLPLELSPEQEAQLPAEILPAEDVVTSVADAPATAAGPSRPLAQPIWSGVYAPSGEAVPFVVAADQHVVDLIPTDIHALPVDSVALVDASPIVVDAVPATPHITLPAYVDWLVTAEADTPHEAPELALLLELADQSVLAWAPLVQDHLPLEASVDTPAAAPTLLETIGEARIVPVLTPAEQPLIVGAPAPVTRQLAELDAAVDVGTAEVERAPEHESVMARLVPVLTPAPRDELTDATLRAVASYGALGAFGAPSAPTIPLPGRASRRPAFALTETNEDQPSAD